MNKITLESPNIKKILFAAVPADGHFNPMIPLAKHMQKAGYDVRWYAATKYEYKLNELKIPMFRFRRELDVAISDAETAFPERAKIKSALGRLRFDLEEFFIKRGPVYFEDIQKIYKTFPFDLFVSDIAFTGSIFVKQILKKPVIAIGVLPLIETSKDLAPSGLGLEPPSGWIGRLHHYVLRMAVKNILLRRPNRLSHRLLAEKGVDHQNIFLFDLIIQKSDYVLQSGAPGFEYKRSDLSNNIKFIGPLVCHRQAKRTDSWFDDRLLNYEMIILITQGTIEKDPGKLLIPALEALKDTGSLIIVTTGGSFTEELKSRYNQPNIIVEDYLDFNDVMPYADVYITNGGYGGVMMSIENSVPMVVAGVHEGKNEICTRVGYFKCGVDLKTETPDIKRIRSAVFEVLANPIYKQNIDKLRNEFKRYNPNELFENYVAELTEQASEDKLNSRRAA